MILFRLFKNSSKNFLFNQIFYVIFFAILYYINDHYIEKNSLNVDADIYGKNYKLLCWDYFHFSLVTQTTLGYGALIPKKPFGKFLNSLQLLTILTSVTYSIF